MSRRKRSHAGLSRWHRSSLYIIGVGVWVTGGMWLICRYQLVKQGEFGPTNSPLEPWSLKLHGLFAFGSLWLLGLFWGIHISKFWMTKRKRWSGMLVTGLLLVLAGSGYLLYYVGDDRVRSLVSVVHWTLGLVLPVAFVWHKLQQRSKTSDAAMKSGRLRRLSTP